MYLVSIYFDEKTDNRMRKLIKQVAEKTGNAFMTENHVPPHMTIGKQLTKEQMVTAFEVIQKQFVPITGQVVKIGIAKPNPHRDLKIWQLMDCKDDRFVL